MEKFYKDRKTKATFETDLIGNHIILNGVNHKGRYKIPIVDLESIGLEPIESYDKLSKTKYKGGWELKLADILMNHKPKRVVKESKPSPTSIILNFTDPVEEPKIKKETKKVIKPKKETKKVIKKVISKDSGSEVTLAQICEELGIKPSAARGKLRGKVDKPESGWKWTNPKEIERIKKVIRG